MTTNSTLAEYLIAFDETYGIVGEYQPMLLAARLIRWDFFDRRYVLTDAGRLALTRTAP